MLHNTWRKEENKTDSGDSFFIFIKCRKSSCQLWRCGRIKVTGRASKLGTHVLQFCFHNFKVGLRVETILSHFEDSKRIHINTQYSGWHISSQWMVIIVVKLTPKVLKENVPVYSTRYTWASSKKANIGQSYQAAYVSLQISFNRCWPETRLLIHLPSCFTHFSVISRMSSVFTFQVPNYSFIRVLLLYQW